MARAKTSVAREVVVFALAGMLMLVLIGLAGVFVLRRIGTSEAMREAENLATVAALGVVDPAHLLAWPTWSCKGRSAS